MWGYLDNMTRVVDMEHVYDYEDKAWKPVFVPDRFYCPWCGEYKLFSKTGIFWNCSLCNRVGND